MKLVISLLLCLIAVMADAGIVSPLFFPSPANNLIYPIEYRKIVSYDSKPTFTQIFKPNLIGGVQLYTFPEIPAPLFLVPTLKTITPSTLVASAKAASGAGVADSSIVAHSDESVPYSVVANAGPDAAYSSAVLHPSARSAPAVAGAHAAVSG